MPLSRRGRAFKQRWHGLLIFVSEISKYLCAQYFFAILLKRLRLIQRSLLLVLNKILSQDACSLIPRKQYCFSLLVASQLIVSISEAVLGCVRISQGGSAPPRPYLSCALALRGFVHVFNHLRRGNSSGLSRTAHVHCYAHTWVCAGPWSDCVLCCTTSCNISHCHWLICHEFLQLPEQTVGSAVVHDSQRAFLALVLSALPLAPLSCSSILVLQKSSSKDFRLIFPSSSLSEVHIKPPGKMS